MSFGTELRRERETRGIDLAAIAAGTKLSERYLRALEADDHAQLPGGNLNKGMVRGYCRHLGLDEHEWLERFNAASVPVAASEPDWESFAENVKRSRTFAGASRRRWWGIVLMLVVLTALTWGVWHFIVKPRMTAPRVDTPAVGEKATRETNLPIDRSLGA